MATLNAPETQDSYYGTAFLTGPNGATATDGHVGGFGDTYVSLLQFDITSLPAGAVISSAILTVVVTGAAGQSCVPITKRITSSWNAATISLATGGQEGGTPIWDAGTNWGSFGWTNTNGAANAADVTGLVQAWFAGTYSNFGFCVFPTNTGSPSNADTGIGLKNNATSGNRPTLVITYTLPTNVRFNNRGLRPARYTPGRAR